MSHTLNLTAFLEIGREKEKERKVKIKNMYEVHKINNCHFQNWKGIFWMTPLKLKKIRSSPKHVLGIEKRWDSADIVWLGFVWKSSSCILPLPPLSMYRCLMLHIYRQMWHFPHCCKSGLTLSTEVCTLSICPWRIKELCPGQKNTHWERERKQLRKVTKVGKKIFNYKGKKMKYFF